MGGVSEGVRLAVNEEKQKALVERALEGVSKAEDELKIQLTELHKMIGHHQLEAASKARPPDWRQSLAPDDRVSVWLENHGEKSKWFQGKVTGIKHEQVHVTLKRTRALSVFLGTP